LKSWSRKSPELGGEAYKELEAFGKADAGLNLKSLGLPPAEVETRKRSAKTKEKALLTDKNKEFEIQLFASQAEACPTALTWR